MEEIELNDNGRRAHETKRNKKRRTRKLRCARLSTPKPTPRPRRMTKASMTRADLARLHAGMVTRGRGGVRNVGLIAGCARRVWRDVRAMALV